MIDQKLRRALNALADLAGLPWWGPYSPGTWLEAQVLVESGGNPGAIRYEAHQDQTPDGDTPGKNDGVYEDDASYGLLQTMGYNVRSILGVPSGTPMNFSALLRPIMGLAFGLRILADELSATGGNVDRALARYNGGPSGERRDASGQMRTQGYVELVRARAGKVHAERMTSSGAPGAV